MTLGKSHIFLWASADFCKDRVHPGPSVTPRQDHPLTCPSCPRSSRSTQVMKGWAVVGILCDLKTGPASARPHPTPRLTGICWEGESAKAQGHVTCQEAAKGITSPGRAHLASSVSPLWTTILFPSLCDCCPLFHHDPLFSKSQLTHLTNIHREPVSPRMLELKAKHTHSFSHPLVKGILP